MLIMISSLSTVRTGFREYRLPVFSEWNSMKPNLSSVFKSCWTDLKSLLRNLASA